MKTLSSNRLPITNLGDAVVTNSPPVYLRTSKALVGILENARITNAQITIAYGDKDDPWNGTGAWDTATGYIQTAQDCDFPLFNARKLADYGVRLFSEFISSVVETESGRTLYTITGV